MCPCHVPALAVSDDETVKDVLVHLEPLLFHHLQDLARTIDVALLAVPVTKRIRDLTSNWCINGYYTKWYRYR